MIADAPVISATVGGAVLDVKDGSEVTFDTKRSPHVEGTLRIAWPSPEVMAALDPRQSPPPRVVVTVPREGLADRVFSLTLRGRPIAHRASEVTVRVASDEALVSDWAPMVDDLTPLTLQSSLKAICQYVIGKAIPGATVAGDDADVTAYWDLKNLSLDPRGTDYTKFKWGAQGTPTVTQSNTTGISSVLGSGATTATKLAMTSTPSGWVELRREESVTELETYSFAVAGRYDLGGTATGTRTLQARLQWMNRDGAPIREDAGVAVSVNDPGTGASAWTRVVLQNRKAPRGAAFARLILRISGLVSGGTLEGTLWQLVPYREIVPYFDGYTPNDAIYAYTWDGDANASTSSRTPTVERDPDSLIIVAGQSGMEFLAPLVLSKGLRLVCDENRAWTLRSETFRNPGTITVRDGVNLIDADDTISRESGLWFDAAIRRHRWTGRDGVERVRVDSFALSGTPSRVDRREFTTPYPGPGRAAFAVREAQTRGREIEVTTRADWTANSDQGISITLKDAPLQVGTIQQLTFDLAQNRMSIRTSTSEIPEGAIDLLTGTIDALTGTIDAL